MNTHNRFTKSPLRFAPLGVAAGYVSLVYFSKATGVGPGLLLFVIAYALLPIVNFFAIAFCEKPGRLWAVIASVACYLFLTVYSLIPGREFPRSRPDGEQMMGAIYVAMFAATFFATFTGWVASKLASVSGAVQCGDRPDVHQK